MNGGGEANRGCKHACLVWFKYMPAYCNKDIREKTWKEIETMFGQTGICHDFCWHVCCNKLSLRSVLVSCNPPPGPMFHTMFQPPLQLMPPMPNYPSSTHNFSSPDYSSTVVGAPVTVWPSHVSCKHRWQYASVPQYVTLSCMHCFWPSGLP